MRITYGTLVAVVMNGKRGVYDGEHEKTTEVRPEKEMMVAWLCVWQVVGRLEGYKISCRFIVWPPASWTRLELDCSNNLLLDMLKYCSAGLPLYISSN